MPEKVWYTPSSMNGQPWRFVVIRDQEAKSRIADAKNASCPEDKADFSSDFLRRAPVLIAICVEKSRSHDREMENGVLAAATLMLAAAARNLGTVYLSAYRDSDPSLQQAISGILELAPDVEPISLIPLGYPAETPAAKSLRLLSEMVDHV